jgi:hypothetical protein
MRLHQLFLDHLGDAQRPDLREMLTEEHVEHPAQHVAAIAAKHPFRFKGLTHLLEERGQEHAFEPLGDLVYPGQLGPGG